MQGQPSVQASSIIGNPDITPETLTEVSGGLDLRAFGGRLGFEGTLYRRTITDLLLQPPARPSSGYGTLVINAGALRNQGVELALNGTPLQTRSFSLDSRVTFQRKNELVTNLPESVPPFSPASSFNASFGRNRITQGHQSSEIWGNVPVDASGRILPVGSYVTNPTAIAARVDTVIGNANPDFQMFFENSLRWRRVRLSATADWRHGGDVANTTTKLYDEGATAATSPRASRRPTCHAARRHRRWATCRPPCWGLAISVSAHGWRLGCACVPAGRLVLPRA